MLPIQKKQIQYNFTPMIGRKIDYIIIHDVGAVSSAIANFNYFNTGNRNASADFFVDPSNIIQANDYTKNFSWQCGDGHGVYGITNANSIGIEMCLIEPFETTLNNTIELVKYLMKELNIDINHVCRHYDASHKNCPNSLSANNWAKWIWFKNQLVETPPQPKPQPQDTSVLQIQQKLNKLHITDYEGKRLDEDNLIGERTRSAVRKFEEIMGFAINGNWDNQCEAAYQQIISKPYCDINNQRNKYAVRYIQWIGGARPIDGIWGNISNRCVYNWQKNHGLVADSKFGNQSWGKAIG